MKALLILALILLTSNLAKANSQDSILVNQCPTTPEVWQLIPAPTIEKSNNLRRRTGSAEFAKGDFIILEGRITDSNCVPIADALIQVWHANNLGIYEHVKGNYSKKDKNFVGSGSTITDTLGYYRFLTIFPGSTNGDAPHINFTIQHKDFFPFETSMYFENHALNQTDPILNKEVDQQKHYLLVAKAEKINKNNQEEDIKYRFDITLEGKNKYLNY